MLLAAAVAAAMAVGGDDDAEPFDATPAPAQRPVVNYLLRQVLDASAYVSVRGPDGLLYLMCRDDVPGAPRRRPMLVRVQWLAALSDRLESMIPALAARPELAEQAARMHAFFAQHADGVSRIFEKLEWRAGFPDYARGFAFCNWSLDAADRQAWVVTEVMHVGNHPARDASRGDDFYFLSTFNVLLHEFAHLLGGSKLAGKATHGPEFAALLRQLDTVRKRDGNSDAQLVAAYRALP